MAKVLFYPLYVAWTLFNLDYLLLLLLKAGQPGKDAQPANAAH